MKAQWSLIAVIFVSGSAAAATVEILLKPKLSLGASEEWRRGRRQPNYTRFKVRGSRHFGWREESQFAWKWGRVKKDIGKIHHIAMVRDFYNTRTQD